MKKFTVWLLMMTFICNVAIGALAVTHEDYPFPICPGDYYDDGYGFGQGECT